MKSKIFLLVSILFLVFAPKLFAADAKVSELPEVTTPTNDDLLYIIDDPAGVRDSKRITYSNLMAPHLNDATDAHDASAISNVPAGNLAATDVQGALNELQTDIDNHLSDTTDAHDASAISSVPAGNLAATDVQAALNELDTEKLGVSANAVTATALASNPTDCASGAYAHTIAANGNLSCNILIVSSGSDPTANDDSGDGYIIGTKWINTSSDSVFHAADVTVGAAVWKKMSEVVAHSDLTELNDDDHSQYPLVEIFTGSVPVGGCTTDRQFFIKTDATPNAFELYGCSGAGATPVKTGANDVGIVQIATQSGSFNPSAGGSSVALHGENGLSSRYSSGTLYLGPSVTQRRRVCMLTVGDGVNTIADADFAPFKVGRCYIPYAATIVEITIQGDAGTPTVLLERRRDSATLADLLSGALTGAGTTEVCAMSSISQTCINGTTSSGTITLSNTALSAGDWIEVKNGTGSTAKSLSIAVVFTVDA